MRGFQTADSAQSKGNALKRLLILSGAAGPVAIDVTSNPKIIDTTPQSGMLPGLLISATATTRWRAETFRSKISAMEHFAAIATDHQMTCASLINDSFFVAGAESQFILRISAVEALCEQPTKSPRILQAIAALQARLKDCDLESDERAALASMLQGATRRSVGQSYKEKFRECDMVEHVKEFDDLYDRRSRLLHDGIGLGDLGEANDKALNIAATLLAGDVKREFHKQPTLLQASAPERQGGR